MEYMKSKRDGQRWKSKQKIVKSNEKIIYKSKRDGGGAERYSILYSTHHMNHLQWRMGKNHSMWLCKPPNDIMEHEDWWVDKGHIIIIIHHTT